MNSISSQSLRASCSALLLLSWAANAAVTQRSELDFAEPKLVTGTIFAIGPEPLRILFSFRRTAVRSGSAVRVLREYNLPDGAIAAREQVLYENGKLVSYDLEELQSGAKGRAVLQPERSNGERQNISFEYAPSADTAKERKSEGPRKDVLINDMIPGFIVSHWDELMKGTTLKFRFIVLSRLETIGFKLVKESETTWHDKPVVWLKMEPTSPLIARLVQPVRFTVERGGEHQILQYIGRTTPMIKRAGKWEDLDAITIF